jgi:hypothetical protein
MSEEKDAETYAPAESEKDTQRLKRWKEPHGALSLSVGRHPRAADAPVILTEQAPPAPGSFRTLGHREAPGLRLHEIYMRTPERRAFVPTLDRPEPIGGAITPVGPANSFPRAGKY